MNVLGLISIKLVGALVPCVLLYWFFRSRSRSTQHLAGGRTFALGCAIFIPAVILELPIQIGVHQFANPLVRSLGDSFLVAAPIEELLKFLVVLLFCSRKGRIQTPLDGLVYGALAALGFATVENVLYVMQMGLGIAAIRALLTVPGHALWGALMGYYFGLAQVEPERRVRLMVKGLAGAVLLHGIFDFSLLFFAGEAALVQDLTARLLLGLLLLVPVVMIGVEAVRTLLLIRRLRANPVILPILDVLPAEPVLLNRGSVVLARSA